MVMRNVINHAPTAGAWRLIYICRGVISVFYKWHGVSRRDVIYHVSHL